MPKFTMLLQESIVIRNSDDVINAIQNGDMIKYLNGKKNLPVWLKSAVDSGDENTVNKVKELLDNLITQVKNFAHGNGNINANEPVLMLIKKSETLGLMEKIINDSMDALVNMALAANKGWYKGTQSVKNVNDNPYNAELWHDMEKDLQDKLANTRQRMSANKKANIANETDSYKILYQDDNWVLAQPKSFKGDAWLASNMKPFECENRRGEDSNTTKTQWCTAADEMYYNRYKEDGNSYYIIKTPGLFDSDNAWQIAFCSQSHVEFMDKYDERKFYKDFISKAPDELLSKIVIDNPKSKYYNLINLLDVKNAGLDMSDKKLDMSITVGNSQLNKLAINNLISTNENAKRLVQFFGNADIASIQAFLRDVPQELQYKLASTIGIKNVITKPALGRDYPKLGVSKNILLDIISSEMSVDDRSRLIKTGIIQYVDEKDEFIIKSLLHTPQGKLITRAILNNMFNSDIRSITFSSIGRLLKLSYDKLRTIFNDDFKSLPKYLRSLFLLMLFENVDIDFTAYTDKVLKIIKAIYDNLLDYSKDCIETPGSLISFVRGIANTQDNSYYKYADEVAETLGRIPRIDLSIDRSSNALSIIIVSKALYKLSKKYVESVTDVGEKEFLNHLLNYPKEEKVNLSRLTYLLYDCDYNKCLSNIPWECISEIIKQPISNTRAAWEPGLYAVVNKACVLPEINKDKDIINALLKSSNQYSLEAVLRDLSSLKKDPSNELTDELFKRILVNNPHNLNGIDEGDLNVIKWYFKDVDNGIIDPNIISMEDYYRNGRNNSIYCVRARREGLDVPDRAKSLTKAQYEQLHHKETDGVPKELLGYVFSRDISTYGYDKCLEFVKYCKSKNIRRHARLYLRLFTEQPQLLDEKVALDLADERLDEVTSQINFRHSHIGCNTLDEKKKLINACLKYKMLPDNIKLTLPGFNKGNIIKLMSVYPYKDVLKAIEYVSTKYDLGDEPLKFDSYIGWYLKGIDIDSAEAICNYINQSGAFVRSDVEDIAYRKSFNEIKLIERKVREDFDLEIEDGWLSTYFNLYFKDKLYNYILSLKNVDDNVNRRAAMAVEFNNTDYDLETLKAYVSTDTEHTCPIKAEEARSFGPDRLISISKLLKRCEENEDFKLKKNLHYSIWNHKDVNEVDTLVQFTNNNYTLLNNLSNTQKCSHGIDKTVMHYIADIRDKRINPNITLDDYSKELSTLSGIVSNEDIFKFNTMFMNSDVHSYKDETGQLKRVYIKTGGKVQASDVEDFNEYNREILAMEPGYSNFEDFMENRVKYIRDIKAVVSTKATYDYVRDASDKQIKDFLDYKAKGGKLDFFDFGRRLYYQETFKRVYELSKLN